MSNLFYSIVGPLIGWSILAALFSFLALPLLLGLLMAFRVVRYREWPAMVAVALNLLTLAANGNYLYNLMNWQSSRFPTAMNVADCALTFGTPVILFILILTLTRRRLLWGVGMPLLVGLALLVMRAQYMERKESDAASYREQVKLLSPHTGTPLVRWWRDVRSSHGPVLLQGHVPRATPLVLLTDPFSQTFQPGFCTAEAASYTPPAKDPAVLGNVTEAVGLKGCAEPWRQGLAVLERPVASYRAVAFAPYAGAPDPAILAHPLVRRRFEELGYEGGNFEPAKAVLSQAAGPPQSTVFLTALMPRKSAPNAFPCTGPVLLVSVRDRANIKAVLPYCALTWNLFDVDDDRYLAAITQQPTPPAEDLMNPDTTYWLFRVANGDLQQMWPE
jgi:hypothetical protein